MTPGRDGLLRTRRAIAGSPVAGLLSRSHRLKRQGGKKHEETEEVEQSKNPRDIVLIAHANDGWCLGRTWREPDEVNDE